MYRLRQRVGNLSLTLSLLLLLGSGATAQVEKSTNDTKTTKTMRTVSVPVVSERGSDLKESLHVVAPSDPVVKILRTVDQNVIIPKVDNTRSDGFDILLYICGGALRASDFTPLPDPWTLPSTPKSLGEPEIDKNTKDRQTSPKRAEVIQVKNDNSCPEDFDPLQYPCGDSMAEDFMPLPDRAELKSTSNDSLLKSDTNSKARQASPKSADVIQVDAFSEDDALLFLFCAGGTISAEDFAFIQDLLDLPSTVNNPPSRLNVDAGTPDRQTVRKQRKVTRR
jgi:hypothetical protein